MGIEIADEGILLSARAQGETGARVTILLAREGRWAGLVKGGQSRRLTPLLQPGNRVEARWLARLEDQLGTFALELITPHAAAAFASREATLVLAAGVALADMMAPERQPLPDLFQTLSDLVASPSLNAYMRFEMAALAALGYGLDLEVCAVTGQRHALTHISPKSGRAVSEEAAAPYEGRLISMPALWRTPWDDGDGEVTQAAYAEALKVTGFFLERHLADPFGRNLPPARSQLLATLLE